MNVEGLSAARWPTPWALIGVAVALCLVTGSGLIDLQRGNATLRTVHAQQLATLAASRKSEDQLNALARGVRQLADGGDANAQAIVATLQRNGIVIHPDDGHPDDGHPDDGRP